jgi:hypothetical protein
MGIDASRVKMALQRRVGQPMYTTVNELMDAAFREHREQEDIATTENNSTPTAFEGGIRSSQPRSSFQQPSSSSMLMPMESMISMPERRESASTATTEESQDAEDEDEVSSQESQEEPTISIEVRNYF